MYHAFSAADPVLSPWSPSPFSVKGVDFQSLGQAIAFFKAEYFGATRAANEILQAVDARACVAISSRVGQNDDPGWTDAMRKALWHCAKERALQSPQQAAALIMTQGKPLAFCAANERRLSAGVLLDDEALSRSEELPGANWMGKALTHIRDTLLSPLLPLTDESVGRASTNRERAILLGLTLYYMEKAAGIWGRRFKIGEIGIGLRGRAAGMAYLESFNIVYNERLFLENPEHFINGTVPHEVAHIVATQLYGPRIPGHGAEWKSVMKALGHAPQRCHDLSIINTGADVGKRMIATCGNHLFLLSPKRSASSCRCKKCNRKLRALWPEQEVRDAIERLRKQGRPL